MVPQESGGPRTPILAGVFGGKEESFPFLVTRGLVVGTSSGPAGLVDRAVKPVTLCTH